VSLIRYHTILLTGPQNTQFISKIDVLLIQGLTPTVLSLPPLPPPPRRTAIYQYPYIYHPPVNLRLCPNSLTFQFPRSAPGRGRCNYGTSHTHFPNACPTRAPGDVMHMHSILNTYFHSHVSGEEKKRIQGRICGSCSWVFASFLSPIVYLYYSGTHERTKTLRSTS
jgi:hypothetical protein